jgi:ATP-dependent RNA helicase RhlE
MRQRSCYSHTPAIRAALARIGIATPPDEAITMNFESLGLRPELLRALSAAGYQSPTPIQAQAIPPILAGRDLMASAQTGTGKTAGFALPLLQLLASSGTRAAAKRARALILVPTRELAAQVLASVQRYGQELRLSSLAIYGGVSERPQIAAAAKGIDVLIATPGRLIDLLQQQAIALSDVRHLVLDEADRMLDMGFLPAIKRILGKLPQQRQTLMFSATFAPELRGLAASMLRQPAEVDVSPRNSTAVTVEHRVHLCEDARKRDALLHLLHAERRQTLVFSRTKHGADRVVRFLDSYGLRSAALHGNKSQAARTRALSGFKSGEIQVLVATDIASRGIDIKELPAVINFDLPNVPEDYVHRIGRTGRAGSSGLAISLVGREDQAHLKGIERLLKQSIKREALGDFSLPDRVAPEVEKQRQPRPSQRPPLRADRGERQRHPARAAAHGKPRQQSQRTARQHSR